MANSPGPDSQPLPNQPARSAGFYLLVSAVVLAIVVAALLALNARRIVAAYKHWQADRTATQAMQLIEDQRWEAASHLLRDALRYAPNQSGLLRATAELFSRGYNDPYSALQFQRKLLLIGPTQSRDHLRLGELLLRTGDVEGAERTYDSLHPTDQNSRQGMELKAGVLEAWERDSEARALLRRAWQLPPHDTHARLQLAIMDQEEAFEEAKPSTAAAIWQIAALDDPVAIQALSYLSKGPVLTAATARKLKALAENHPRITDQVRYEVLQAYLRLIPDEKRAVLAAEVKRNKGRPLEEQFHFLRWLGVHKEHARILELLPERLVLRDPDLFLVYADALAAAEDWNALLELVNKGGAPISTATGYFIKARCYARLKDEGPQVRREIGNTYKYAGREEIALVQRASALAAELQHFDLAVQGCLQVAEARPQLKNKMLEQVLQLQRKDQDMNGMLTTLRALVTSRPDSNTYADQLNYLRLVAGQEMETAFAEVAIAADAAPSAGAGAFPLPLLRALAAWRFGQSETLRLALHSMPEPARLPPGQRAVVAGLLAAAGRDVEGFRLGEKISSYLLLEGELRLLQLAFR